MNHNQSRLSAQSHMDPHWVKKVRNDHNKIKNTSQHFVCKRCVLKSLPQKACVYCLNLECRCWWLNCNALGNMIISLQLKPFTREEQMHLQISGVCVWQATPSVLMIFRQRDSQQETTQLLYTLHTVRGVKIKVSLCKWYVPHLCCPNKRKGIQALT